MKYYQVEVIIREIDREIEGYSKIVRETICQNMLYYDKSGAYKEAIRELNVQLDAHEATSGSFTDE